MTAYDVVVIGAGHNGLVAAAYLARAGKRVLVLEARDEAGGCAATEELWPGYHVDTGAHGLTALDPRVASDLGLTGSGLDLVTPDPTVVAPRAGGDALVLSHDMGATAESIRRTSTADAARWPDFVAALTSASRALEVLYASAPPRVAGADRGDLWELARLGGRLGRLGRREALELMRLIPMTIEELLDEWFESPSLKGALAAGGITGICQGPMASGTAYVFLHGMVGAAGVVGRRSQPRGGMRALGSALAERATGAGAEVRLGTRVASILIDDGRAEGVSLASGETVGAAVVLSSADPGQTFQKLIDPVELDPEFRTAVDNIKYRGVCAKVHFALSEPPRLAGQDPDAQNAVLAGAAIRISPSIEYLERAYDDAKYGRPSENPYIEAVLTSAVDPALAPDGRHILSALVQYAPYSLREGTWDEASGERLGDTAQATLAAVAPNFDGAVTHRHVYTPTDLADRFMLTEANIYHGEMTLDQVFIGRPVPGWARYGSPIEGLYSCGAGTHPGGGLHGRPGAAAARMVLG